MRKICVIGHFGSEENLLNGQTIKTKIITNELERQFGFDDVHRIDTHGGTKAYIKLPFQILQALRSCKNVIIFPAQNGVRIIVPLLTMINILFQRNLHYVVIGGWLPDFIQGRKSLTKLLKKFRGIYVETNSMKQSLEEQGFHNLFIVPNCKELRILREDQLVYNDAEPYKLCTFSRVMKEKGIEEAINAVKAVNQSLNRVVFTLDIYGQVDSEQAKWFQYLQDTFPEYVKYGGLIPFDQSTEVLKDYFALLFPTYYEGEGFAGTLIDAMASGIPVVASDWKYNSEIVKDGITGQIIKEDETLDQKLLNMLICPQSWLNMKIRTINESKRYLPVNAITELIANLP